MKRIFVLTLVLMMAATLITGCGNEKGSGNKNTGSSLDELNATLLEKMETVDSVHVDKKMAFELTVDGTKGIIMDEAQSDISIIDGIAHCHLYSQDGGESEIEWYKEETEDGITIYKCYDGNEYWDVDEFEKDSDAYMDEFTESKSFLRAFKGTKQYETKVNEAEAYGVIGIIDKNAITKEDIEIILNVFDGASLEQVNLDTFEKNLMEGDELEVEVIYDAETMLPLKITCDVNALLRAYADSMDYNTSEIDFDEISVGETSCVYNFSDYNNVSVSIPDTVKERN